MDLFSQLTLLLLLLYSMKLSARFLGNLLQLHLYLTQGCHSFSTTVIKTTGNIITGPALVMPSSVLDGTSLGWAILGQASLGQSTPQSGPPRLGLLWLACLGRTSLGWACLVCLPRLISPVLVSLSSLSGLAADDPSSQSYLVQAWFMVSWSSLGQSCQPQFRICLGRDLPQLVFNKWISLIQNNMYYHFEERCAP